MILYYSKDVEKGQLSFLQSRYHNVQIYGNEGNLNMADIECRFERRLFYNTI